MRTITESITPEIAKKYLIKNKGNRSKRQSVIDFYAQQMKSGEWMLSPQGISFDEDGDLLDGQHRLEAVVASGCTVDFRVTTGCAHDLSPYLDRGVVRMDHDVLAISGVRITREDISSINIIRDMIERQNLKGTVKEKIEIYSKFSSGFKAIPVRHAGTGRIPALVRAPFVMYAQNNNRAYDLWRTVVSGENIKGDSPEMMIRKLVLSEKPKGGAGERIHFARRMAKGILIYHTGSAARRVVMSEEDISEFMAIVGVK